MRREALKLGVRVRDEVYPEDLVVHLPEGPVPMVKVTWSIGQPELVGTATLAREPGAVVAETDVVPPEGWTVSVGFTAVRSDVDEQGVTHHREIRVLCAVLAPLEMLP